MKLANSQALVTALCLEHGALGYLCIMYWFGGTTLGCKTKIKKLGINYFFFSRGHTELVSHSWNPPGKKKTPKCLPVWWTLEYWFFFLWTKKGLCSQYFPPSSDRAATFLSTPSKVTACSVEASTCQMYACFVIQLVFVAFAVSINPFFFFFFK